MSDNAGGKPSHKLQQEATLFRALRRVHPIAWLPLLASATIAATAQANDRSIAAELNGKAAQAYRRSLYTEMYRQLRNTPAKAGRQLPPFPELAYPLAEVPPVLPTGVVEKLKDTTHQLLPILLDPQRVANIRAFLPEGLRGLLPKAEETAPAIVAIDYALVNGADGSMQPRLVEVQGFSPNLPSIIRQGQILVGLWSERDGLPRLTSSFDGLGTEGACTLFEQTVAGGHDLQRVAMVDYDPVNQRLHDDVHLAKRMFGLRPVSTHQLAETGGRIIGVDALDGASFEVAAIYNRALHEDPDAAKFPWGIDISAQHIDLTPHYAWQYLLSKRSMIDVEHPAVPKTITVAEADSLGLPDGYQDLVLKPLDGFGGQGVKVGGLSEAELAAIPDERRDRMALQERLHYAKFIPAFDGGENVAAEIRVVALSPTRRVEDIVVVSNLARLGRGPMMNSGFNDAPAVGASVALWPVE